MPLYIAAAVQKYARTRLAVVEWNALCHGPLAPVIFYTPWEAGVFEDT